MSRARDRRYAMFIIALRDDDAIVTELYEENEDVARSRARKHVQARGGVALSRLHSHTSMTPMTPQSRPTAQNVTRT